MTVSRRKFLVGLLTSALISPLVLSRCARAAIETENLDEFERILKARMRARRPEEIAFIATVVALVRSGKLPRELVEAAFAWVIQKKKYERYPAVWFERSLRALAARDGIAIP